MTPKSVVEERHLMTHHTPNFEMDVLLEQKTTSHSSDLLSDKNRNPRLQWARDSLRL